MNIYIALLRGINVGGKNIIKMADLKRVFEGLGFCEVRTYIQSGNVLFKANEPEETLRKQIESELESKFGFSVKVVLRPLSELESLISNCPFSEKTIEEAKLSSGAESLYVAFLNTSPSKEKIDYLASWRSEKDEYEIAGRDIFLLFYNSIRNSKLSEKLQKIDASATVRNWKTVSKLASLAREMKQ